MNEKKVNQLTLSLLGPFQVMLDGDVLNHFPTDKVRALLAYLVMEANRPHRRDTLAGLLWTEWPNRQARRNLRKSLYWLRQTLDNHRAGISDELLTITRQTVQLDEGTSTLDVAYFLRLLTESESHTHQSLGQCSVCLDRLTKAVSLYKGEFLTGFSLADALTFEEWLRIKRERLQQLVLNTLSSLTAAYEQRQNYEQVQEYATRQLVLEPWREEAHRQLMRALALNRQRNEALAQYGTCRRVLEEELGVEPTAETTTLYEQIRSGAFKRQTKSLDRATKAASGYNQLDQRQINQNNVSASPKPTTDQASSPFISVTPANDSLSRQSQPAIQQNRGSVSSTLTERQSTLQAQAAPLHHFPVQFTPFVGRQPELAQSIDYLTNPACRLLTLCGPGGMGKTRLSIQVGKQIAPRLRLASYSGIYFVSLAEVDSAELVIPALANCLGVPLKGAISAKAQVISYLQNKKILLVMDNFEHLVNGADLLVEILSAAPHVKMLVTSRESLNIRAEWRLILDGLAYPEAEEVKGQRSSKQSDREKPLDLISSYSAIQLFVQAAAHVQPDFSPTEKEQAAIVRICQLIGGMPLAIEIAAAWIRMYDCEAIAEEIARNLDLMITPLRDMPLRHRSMRAVFDHSWRLLSPVEEQALAQISVFRGGFSMKAALAITDATPLEFATLLDKSLLRRMLGGRFEIHELLRQFAAEQLGDTTNQIRLRHSAYYISFLQERTASLQGGKQQKALTEIDQELKNCGMAWEYAVSQQNITAIGTGLEGLFHFYDIRSRFQEGELIFRQAASHLRDNQRENQRDNQRDNQSAIIKAKLQARQGWFTFHLGRTKQSWSLLQNSLTSLRALQAKDDLLFNLNYLGALARHSGQYERAQGYLSEALKIAQVVGDKLAASIALNILGQVASLQGQYEKARELCRQSLQMKRMIGDRWGMTFSLTYLGRVELMLGEYREAKELFQESMTISEIFGDRRGIAFALLNLGNVAKAQGKAQHVEAQRLYQESLYLYNEIGNRQEASLTLIKLGEVACELAAWHEAKFNFRHALATALEINSTPSMLAGLLGMARLHTCLELTSLALPILTFIQQCPDASLTQQAQAKALYAKLAKPATKQRKKEKPVKDLISLVQYVLL